MKWIFNISIAASIIAFSCQGPIEEIASAEIEELDDTSLTFIHPDGDVTFTKINDSVWNAHFINLEGHELDTNLIAINPDGLYSSFRLKNEIVYLKFGLGGLSVGPSMVKVFEFGGFAALPYYTQMPHVYDQPFIRGNRPAHIEGVFYQSKALKSVHQVYLEKQEVPKSGTYIIVEGNVVREKWPEEFLSTDESPQGIAVDNDAYRLVFEEAEIYLPENTFFFGYPVNVSTGGAAIAWEFADSEAYILEGRSPWTVEEQQQKIAVEGYLVQDGFGSILYNWTLYDQDNTIKKEYQGKTVNVNGKGGIHWEGSIAEPFILLDHAPWPENELNKGITVEGVLIPHSDGSYIKDYTILN